VTVNFTAKSRYALKIMIDLASQFEKGVQQREDIARRAGVPSDFMDQITVKLKTAGLIESVRGRNGGYRLTRSPIGITAFDIFDAVEGVHLQPVACIEDMSACESDHRCQSKSAWSTIYSSVKAQLQSHSLASLVSESLQNDVIEAQEKRECIAPKKDRVRTPQYSRPDSQHVH